MGQKNSAVKIVCENRKARHDYFIHETYEAGMELVGTEVKSLRAGKANLRDSYAYVKNGKCSSTTCISAPTIRAISSITTRCAYAVCSCTRQRF